MDLVADGGIRRTRDAKGDFLDSSEGARWGIRLGGEPVDLHLTGAGSVMDNIQRDLGIRAGIGGIFNHGYVEIGRIIDNPDGTASFEVAKRIQAVGLDENGEMTGGGRLVGMIIDGKYTPFSADPILQDDPLLNQDNEPTNELEHVNDTTLFGSPYSEIVFVGTERDVLERYHALVEATIEINAQNPEFGLFGQDSPNSNSFFGEMVEKLNEMGISTDFNAPGIDIGIGYEMDTARAPVYEWQSLAEVRAGVDAIERQAAQQLGALAGNGFQLPRLSAGFTQGGG